MEAEKWQQIKTIFLQSLEIEEARREAFLYESCGENPEIKKEVEKLLAAHFESEGFIETPAFKTPQDFSSDDRWDKVSEILNKVLEKPTEKRRTFLRKLCGNDKELYTEIESLLSVEGSTNDFLGKSPLASANILENLTSLKNKTIGNYKIVREIGRGGMGSVYLATRNDDQFNKRVAIKILRRGMDSEDILKRFRMEERILAALEHPNIARLLDAGITNDGLPYFVMEYVEGEPLDKYCDEHNLNTVERLELFQKVCSAVQYAHQNLIVHRDLKPGNIFVNTAGEPKLLDFGIAKLLNPELTSDTIAPTATFVRLMTPDYASPEQIRGKTITTASDIYSLGILLYKLLTGDLPYHFRDASPQEIERLVYEKEPTKPSEVISDRARINTNETNPKSKIQNLKSLKGDLDNIVLMALRKEPSRRYQSAEAFSDDIRRHLDGLPVLARPNTLGYRFTKFITRHKVGAAAASLILLSLIGGIFISLRQAQVAAREKAKAEAVSQFLQNLLNASNPQIEASRTAGHDTTVKELLDAASQKLETEELSNQPEVKAELKRIIGISYIEQGQYESARKNLESALQLKTELYGENSLETLQTLVAVASLWIATGKNEEADKFYRQRISILRIEQKKGNVQADDLFAALTDFGLLRRAQGDSREAESLFREALDLRSQTTPEMKNAIGTAESVLSLTLADQGNFAEAEKIIRAKLEQLNTQANKESPEWTFTLTMLGSLQMEKGEFDEAEKNLADSETLYRKIHRETYLPLGDNLRLQAQTLYFQGKYAEAETKINEALTIYKQSTTSKYINYATALSIQGLILTHTNRLAEGERLLREAVKIRSENLPSDNFLTTLAKSALGENLTMQKKFNEAESLLLESFENLKKSQGENNPRTTLAKNRLAELYKVWGKPELTLKYQ
ncbi:MAG: protein kinase [Pyrinomonadaceae bacterium]|nr:protein kinase [Pyrinomonadaceae bacterium]